MCQIVIYIFQGTGSSPVAHLVKNLPAMQENWVRFLGQEDPVEKEMATLSSTLACRIPWNRRTWQAMELQELNMT